MANTQELLERLESVTPTPAAIPQIVASEIQPLLDRLNQVAPQQEQVKPDFPGAAIIEPLKTVVTGISAAVGGGISGLVAARLFDPETGANVVEAFQREVSQPETEAGKKSLAQLGKVMERIIAEFRITPSIIGGLIKFFSGGNPKEVAKVILSIREKGVGEVAADVVLKETGDPVLATLARIGPEAIVEILGFKGATKGVTAFKKQSATKQRITEILESGSGDIEAVRFKIAAPKPLDPGALPLDPIEQKLLGFIDVGGPKIIDDVAAIDAINRGFDEGVIMAVKGASPIDKTKMLEMVNIMEKGKQNKLFSVTNRPGDVAGNSLLERFKILLKTNRKAGSELDGVANTLRGKEIDVSVPVNEFIEALDSLGVRFGKDLKPRFKGSDIEGSTGAQKIIADVIKRMKLTKVPDARDVHRLKKFIDERVVFGKSIEGLAGKTERIIKNLRRNLDQLLDSNFPEYDRVNTVFAETINAMDALQDVAGKKFNLSGPNADKAVGVLLRRLMSNAQSRTNLLDAIGEVEQVARKHAPPGSLTDDLLTQTLFVDELDAVFGPVARTSFQGQIDQAIQQGVKETTRGVIKKTAIKAKEKLLGTDEERAFAAIKKLLNE